MKNNLLVVIANIIIIAIFAIVSIYFGKWWITLFSGLFCFYHDEGNR